MAMTTEQLIERRNGIGGSDASAVLGISKWKTPIEVFLEKTSNALEGMGKDSEASYWGNELEEVVAREFTKRTGKQVRRANDQLVHPEYPFLIGHIDRKVVGEKAFLECKTTNQYNASRWEGDEIPQEYLIQCMHYLALTGYDTAYIAVLIGGQKFVFKKIDRDESLIKLIVEKEVSFWREFVEKKIPPMIDGSNAASNVLSFLYPEAVTKEIIPIDKSFNKSIERKIRMEDLIDRLQEKCDEIENNLKMVLGSNEIGDTGIYNVVWKNVTANRFDTTRFKEEKPELYSEYSYQNTSRRFSIKNKKGKEL